MAFNNLRALNMLKQGQPIMATFLALRGMRHAQILASTGIDAVIIDCEHGNIDDNDMHNMVTAVAAAGASPIVRIRGPSGALIKRALDTGAHGLLVPMTNTAEEARSVVSFAKFPPRGVRGYGSAFAHFAHGLSTQGDYVATANDNVLTMVQIESLQGLTNVDEICRVDGVDLIFIGPNDLALALLGYTPAKYTEPEFLEAIETIVRAARAAGKKVGVLVADGEQARKAKERFDMVAIGTEVRAIQAWYRRELEIANS